MIWGVVPKLLPAPRCNLHPVDVVQRAYKIVVHEDADLVVRSQEKGEIRF